MTARASSNGFDAARARRRLANWNPTAASLRTLIASDGAMMRARARDVIRNNPYAASACESFVGNAVGAGITPSSLIKDQPTREAVQALFLEWTDESDADGVCDFYGQQALAARALFSSGEIFARFRPRRPDDGLSVPLQVQLLASDMLDMSHTTSLDSGNSVINGVEFDLLGRRVAYHFYRSHPGDQALGIAAGEKVRVPASEVLHVFRVQEPGQVRGYPMVAAAIVKLWFLDQYDDAEAINRASEPRLIQSEQYLSRPRAAFFLRNRRVRTLSMKSTSYANLRRFPAVPFRTAFARSALMDGGKKLSADDVLYGVPAIADAFRLKPRQVYHLKDEHGLPTYKVGRTVCARRGAVLAWFAEREAAARIDASGGQP